MGGTRVGIFLQSLSQLMVSPESFQGPTSFEVKSLRFKDRVASWFPETNELWYTSYWRCGGDENRADMEPEVGAAGGISYVGIRIEMVTQVSHETAVISTSSSRSWSWHGMRGKRHSHSLSFLLGCSLIAFTFVPSVLPSLVLEYICNRMSSN